MTLPCARQQASYDFYWEDFHSVAIQGDQALERISDAAGT